ncbi:hypothetical protein M422DRAFT_785054 [Sphaerobolus stellatus SS14]|uniref:Chromatin target of PRMT1 protein C-terminal domain-containing protein n=1 Tax=Sphaerobolus stellatus (strain SS14) TaxID=990650 RepID=A0A0C9TCT1_SPHS4|nr:hypothetical protein M422DRAFT_785054 [Sphaerobolus stellatus SS14]
MEMDEPELMFIPAHSLPMALYPIEERINTALGSKKSEDLKQPIQMRWALPSDQKARDAKSKSQFYKRFGETAGKPGVVPGTGRDEAYDTYLRRREDDEETRRQLDAELEGFVQEEETGDVSLGNRMGGRRSNKRGFNDEDKRRMLDQELDAFLAAGETEDITPTLADQEMEEEPSQPSLLERTRSSRSRSPVRRNGGSLLERTQRSSRSRSPIRRGTATSRRGRRERNETRYQTDEGGRWLHNAEVVQRRRRVEEYDSRSFGMRAWTDGTVPAPAPAPARRSSKRGRTTQEELDRELEEFNRQAD